MNQPDWAADVIYVNTEFHFSFRDRLKLLVGYRFMQHQGVACGNEPGRTMVCEDRLTFGRPKWWPWKPARYGAAEVPNPAPVQEEP